MKCIYVNELLDIILKCTVIHSSNSFKSSTKYILTQDLARPWTSQHLQLSAYYFRIDCNNVYQLTPKLIRAVHLIFISFSLGRNQQKYKTELGLYKTEGKLHQQKPYWESVNSPKRYLYWDKSHRTWYISEQLGKSSGNL